MGPHKPIWIHGWPNWGRTELVGEQLTATSETQISLINLRARLIPMDFMKYSLGAIGGTFGVALPVAPSILACSGLCFNLRRLCKLASSRPLPHVNPRPDLPSLPSLGADPSDPDPWRLPSGLILWTNISYFCWSYHPSTNPLSLSAHVSHPTALFPPSRSTISMTQDTRWTVQSSRNVLPSKAALTVCFVCVRIPPVRFNHLMQDIYWVL